LSELPRDFSFLERDQLWDEDEDIKQKIHNLVVGGEDVSVSFAHKVRRSNYLRSQEDRLASYQSFHTMISPRNMRIRKLRAQRLDRILRPYWEWLLNRLNHECQICHRVFNPADLHVDHCRPLSRGGKNEWDNIQPVCPSCNSKKNTKTFFSSAVLSAQREWIKLQGRNNAGKSCQSTVKQSQRGGGDYPGERGV